MLSDLRESGAIEQDADIVTFIYRPEYYKLEQWDDEEQSSCLGQGEFIIAKHRNGALENVRLRFIGNQAKFIDLDTMPWDNKIFPSKINDNSNSQIFESSINSPNIDPKDAFGLEDNEDELAF